MTKFSSVLSAILLVLATSTGLAATLETPAKFVVLMDADSGRILFEKNGTAPMEPASMSKVMTMVMLFEALERQEFTLEDTFIISEDAWRRGGAKSGSSTMFADVHSQIPVEDLIRGVIVQSGNDASIAIAEGLAGSESAFVEIMNRRARELGLDSASFANATGWPHPDHRISARDLAKIARHTIINLADYYHYYSETSFTWNGIAQFNRNPLLGESALGVDGLKTGRTDSAGYGLLASARQQDRRLILVINGLDSEKQRASEARRFLRWGFAAFKTYKLFREGDAIKTVAVWHGVSPRADMTVDAPITVILSPEQRRDMTVSLRYASPLIAPVAAGQMVGTITVAAPGIEPIEQPLVMANGVGRLGFVGRVIESLVTMAAGETGIADGTDP